MTAKEQRLSAADIAARLRDDILVGERSPGERLGEAELAERFGVSRGPVRDALRLVAGSGLIDFTPNIGARVREFSLTEARALYQLREALEGQVATLAAKRVGEADIKRLERLLAEHALVIESHPENAYLQSGKDRDFHLVLAELADSPLIFNLLAQELYPQLTLLRRCHRSSKGRGGRALIEHQRIVEAVSANDCELAGLLMRRHIQASWNSFYTQQTSK